MPTGNVQVTVRGISPLLMHSFPMTALPDGWEKWEPVKQAEIAAYRDPDTRNLYVPGVAIQRSFVAAAVYSKGKGRASLQKQVAACVFVSPERVDLGTKEFTVDSRPVVIAATRGRIVRHRPRLDTWQASFSIAYDPGLLSEKQLRQIVDDAGQRVGWLDFRPSCKGPFGRFMVVTWTSFDN